MSQNQQLEVKISNDKFVFDDKYYTSGIHIIYKRGLENAFIFPKEDDSKLRLGVSLGNETFTPSNLFSFNTNDFDRPYAGWLFGRLELSKIKTNTALSLIIESGVTGKESLAGKLQIAFHDLLSLDVPTWADEISYKWLFNFKLLKTFDFKLNKTSHFQNRTEVSLGSKDTYLENNAYVFLGKLNKFQNSYRSGVVTSNDIKEYYVFFAGGYRYVMLNTLIQGSPFNNNDPFTSIAEKHVFNLKAGGVLRTRRNIFKLEYIYNTKETPMSKSHIYGAFTFGFIF